MTNGMINQPTPKFDSLYRLQQAFQYSVTGLKCPVDNEHEFSYHIQAMVEELGEVLKADKRWKTHRNTRYEPEEKLDEIADVFITAMNIAMYSGVSADTLLKAIQNKVAENFKRLAESKNKEEQ